MDDSEDYMKQMIKKQLHIGKLYRVIYKLANQVGDVSLAEEYHKKIRFMLQSNMSKEMKDSMRYNNGRQDEFDNKLYQ